MPTLAPTPTIITPISSLAPSIIFFNGQVVTMEPDLPLAEAIAVLGQEILAVGTSDQVLALGGPDTRLVDLGGRALLPGFIDAHTHLLSEAHNSGSPTLEEAQEFALQIGITAMADMSVGPSVLKEIQEFQGQGKLRIRTSLYLAYNLHCGEVLGDWYLEHPPDLDQARMLHIPGVKIFTDGWTCGLLPAFSFDLPDARDADSPKGDLLLTEEQLTGILVDLQRAGYQAAIHAVGDQAVENALTALENALDGAPNTLRHRMEHNMYIRPELLRRYGQLGVVPVVWGSKACFIQDTPSIDSWGDPTTHSWINPWRSLLDANPGLHVAFHSDLSWGEPGPLANLYSLVTRNEVGADGTTVCEAPDWLTEEAITVEEALRLMTIEAAYALFMEEKVGSLKPGKFADLVVLSDSPLAVSPDSLLDIDVLLTMVGGRVEHCAPGCQALCP
jgi:predicted amidohydrolase YtcJ